MSEPLQQNAPPTTGDTLLVGVVFMLGVTVIQRIVGFGRSLLFCAYLDDDQLGLWSLAFSFLLLAAPLAVIGLPGSFGRYVEYYRNSGRLRSFLTRTTIFSVVTSVICVLGVWMFQKPLAWFLFKDAAEASLVVWLAVALLIVIAFNFLTELLTALRMARAVSLMQFAHSIFFAVTGVLFLVATPWGAQGVLISYTIACGIAFIGAGLFTFRSIARAANDQEPLANSELWTRLLPFAGWVWVINLLSNLFEAADRYMILHFAPVESIAAQSMVGQYHSSRMLPILLVSVSAMLGGLILPYLSHEWEKGDHDAVARLQKVSLKWMAVGFTAIGSVIMIAAPLIFTYVLRGKYDDGLAVLPWTFVYCIWFSLAGVAQNYLWCAEKAHLGSGALVVGLVANVAMNILLLPVLGLLGAVLATSAANLIALAVIYYYSHREGMRVDVGIVLTTLLPLSLAMGGWVGAAFVMGTIVLSIFGNSIFAADEKDEIVDVIQDGWRKMQTRLASLRGNTAVPPMSADSAPSRGVS